MPTNTNTSANVNAAANDEPLCFFIVWNPRGSNPSMRHPTFDAARAEAMRLALAADRSHIDFFVLQCVGVAQRDVHWHDAATAQGATTADAQNQLRNPRIRLRNLHGVFVNLHEECALLAQEGVAPCASCAFKGEMHSVVPMMGQP